MKRLVSVFLFTILLFGLSNDVSFSAERKLLKSNKVKSEKSYVSNLYSVSKFFANYEYAANNYNHGMFMDLFSENYTGSDGFDKKILSKMVKETWNAYPGIRFKVRLNGVTFYDDIAIANVTESAKGYAKAENDNVAEFISNVNTVYYLKPVNGSWQILNDYTLKENVVLSWGDAKYAKIKFDVPNQLPAGTEYSAMMNIEYPDGIIAIGSITSDKITYPQNPSKEIYRKFSPEGTLERIMKTNTDNTNEYIVATVGFTRPRVDNKQNLDIKLTGYSCIMQRLNVVPINKFIEVEDETAK